MEPTELPESDLSNAIAKDDEQKTPEDEAGPSGYTPTVRKVGKKSKAPKNNPAGNSLSAKDIQEI